VCLAQYLKADILSRKGSVNFNTRVFLGKYDRIAAASCSATTLRRTRAAVDGAPGDAGKAVVEVDGDWTCVNMPRVTDAYLRPFLKRSEHGSQRVVRRLLVCSFDS
jgi:hypothetical protein